MVFKHYVQRWDRWIIDIETWSWFSNVFSKCIANVDSTALDTNGNFAFLLIYFDTKQHTILQFSSPLLSLLLSIFLNFFFWLYLPVPILQRNLVFKLFMVFFFPFQMCYSTINLLLFSSSKPSFSFPLSRLTTSGHGKYIALH